MSRLHLVYRLYAGANSKARPEYFSKLNCLSSFLQATSVVDCDVSFVVDGEIPASMRALVEPAASRIVYLSEGPAGMRRSYMTALTLAVRSDWPGTDTVYFCEDDYLYDEFAFAHLESAVERLEKASYFALYAAKPDSSQFCAPVKWTATDAVRVGSENWVNVPSTTSSFGARLGVLRDDMSIFRGGMRPYRNRILDHETCLVYQGCSPYTVASLIVSPADGSRLRKVAKNALILPFRVIFQLQARARISDPHYLFSPDANLAHHIEYPLDEDQHLWVDRARSADVWADQNLAGNS